MQGAVEEREGVLGLAHEVVCGKHSSVQDRRETHAVVSCRTSASTRLPTSGASTSHSCCRLDACSRAGALQYVCTKQGRHVEDCTLCTKQVRHVEDCTNNQLQRSTAAHLILVRATSQCQHPPASVRSTTSHSCCRWECLFPRWSSAWTQYSMYKTSETWKTPPSINSQQRTFFWYVAERSRPHCARNRLLLDESRSAATSPFMRACSLFTHRMCTLQ